MKKTVHDVQDYWNNRPCNIRHSPKPVGTKEYFDEVEARKYKVEPHIPSFAQFERWKGKRVLEIGCGIGTDTMNFARAGAQITSVDLSSESIALARKRAEVFGLQDRITFVEANIERLSSFLPVETYDLIYSFGVIHHTPRPEYAVTEIRKYMGAHSEFRLMVYNRFSWKVFGILLANLGKFSSIDEIVARYSEAQEGCPVTYTYSRRTVKELLEGLEVTETFVDHIFPYDIAAYKRYEYKMRFPFRLMPTFLFRKLEQMLGWHLCVVCRLPQI